MNYYRFQNISPIWQRFFLLIIRKINNIVYNIFWKSANQKINKYQKQRELGPKKTICYAPYKSMYFGMNGNVVACCLNRSHIFGKYPDNKIDEIWNSKNINILRNALKHSDFSKGCFHCKNRIDSENFEAVEAKLYDIAPLNKNHPTMLEFELSNDCNLQCIMCNSEFSSSIARTVSNIDYKSPYDDEFVLQLEKYIPHLIKAKFLGGEPFLIPIYYKIWEKILELNPKCQILVQSNATVLNEKIKLLLAKGNFRISLSVESFNKENYEKIRKNGSFDKVFENINYFADYAKQRNYPFGISVCPIQQNWDELPYIIEYCNKLEAIVYFNTVWTPNNCSLFSLDIDELAEIIAFLSSHTYQTENEIQQRNYLQLKGFINQLKQWLKDKTEKQLNIETKRNELIHEKDILSKIPLNAIILKVSNYIAEALPVNYSSEEKNHKIEYYQNKLNEVVKNFQSEENLKITLNHLLEFPGELLIQELENTDIKALTKKAIELSDNINNY